MLRDEDHEKLEISKKISNDIKSIMNELNRLIDRADGYGLIIEITPRPYKTISQKNERYDANIAMPL
jgi:hypothetical protein